ncbi:Serine/threonine-protein kinase ATG1 [Cytospora mali]|uniref:non-specific serine/threonine protein kinase n=1 Tax=Cytospora mali TaxID=578113 RepID=A0A194VDQ1_CYTMA|nr:Serine/threonine-protein kinase ATG1 [Valsa mali var. pyri (nom. inval.)]
MASQSSASGRPRTASDGMSQWSVGSKIGKGSFASVYVGTHKSSGAAVAIKSVELGKLKGKVKDNLYSEIKILEKLRHPHIVALHKCVETPTHINLMMEYCQLGDLSLFIKKREGLLTHPATHDMARKYPITPNAGLNEVVIRHFLKQLASALEFLRKLNLVHRDVKPQNLLLLPSVDFRASSNEVPQILSASHDSLIPAAGLRSLPMLKLADFGFARVLPSTSLAETLCGSPLYMAPEILRYERYDAKADLWSVGTVLYEMAAGRPPFRASNHVELLRKIEASNDAIKFPRESNISPEMKSLIRALLKRNPVERITFENFFSHDVVISEIPGLIEDDIPAPVEPKKPEEFRVAIKADEPPNSPSRRSSLRRYGADQDQSRGGRVSPPIEKPYRPSPLGTPTETDKQLGPPSPRLSYSPRQETAEGLGIRRPSPVPSTSAPTRPAMDEARRRALSNASAHKVARDSPPAGGLAEIQRTRPRKAGLDEQEKAQQEIAFERDYVLVDKNQVAVNALADELAANGRMALQAQGQSHKSGQMVRRTTTQGAPDSITGAVAPSPSRAMQIAQGRQRPNAHERQSSLSASPGSTASFISKAIQDASLRLLGIKYPPGLGKGASPPQFYSPFPAYPASSPPVGLIGDGKQCTPFDEDARVAQCIEDYATRSDVVYGFAEVKYKQLVPLAPSMDHGLGGLQADRVPEEDEDGLTIDAVVALSEEALVLYVKALSLLAKSMDIASLWWSRKTRAETSGGHSPARDSGNTQVIITRINSAVQWVRSRFNEVLEKAEVVRLKLIDAQRSLPEDHPSHPSNHPLEPGSASGSSVDGVAITPGISAEKLMYDRAVEMSRKAAIDEISNEDLAGCEISYVTAVRMLEAVIDNDEDLPKRRISGSSKDERALPREDLASDINADDQQAVQKLITMITSRLAAVRKKMRMIASAAKLQQQQQQTFGRRRSGDVTPRSVPSHAS